MPREKHHPEDDKEQAGQPGGEGPDTATADTLEGEPEPPPPPPPGNYPEPPAKPGG